ncbi:MAG: DUF3999 family protein [Trichloromonas sp.]|jgi:hypothetical protein|nr:DUF3999 family protein [Trichloromonas sp.]
MYFIAGLLGLIGGAWLFSETAGTWTLAVRGAGPFLLAYGNANLNSPPAAGADLLGGAAVSGADAPAPERIVPGAIVTLGGEERLFPLRSPPSWRTLPLWGVLGLGVVLVGILAWRLQRQLRQTSGSSTEPPSTE